MSTGIIDEPTGPQRPFSGVRRYRVIPNAVPRRVRRDLSDGHLYGEVRVEATDTNATPDPSLSITNRRKAATWPPPHPRAIPDAVGHDHRPAPELARTPTEFNKALRRYKVWADVSFRNMEERSAGGVSASTFCAALRRSVMPSQALLVAFVTACGADAEECQRWINAWHRIVGAND